MEMIYNQLIRTVTKDYLEDMDMDAIPSISTVESELLELTNREIEAYNLGPEDPNVATNASMKDRYPNQKSASHRYKILKTLVPAQIALCIAKMYRACRVCWLGVNDDQNYTVGVYQDVGENRGIYDTRTDTIKELIREFNYTIDEKGVKEVTKVLEDIAPKKVRCADRDLIPVNNGIFDYKHKILMDFDPEYVFTTKSHVDYIDGVANPVITMPDGELWDVETWMSSLSDDPEVVELLWQVVGSIVRPTVRFNKVILLYAMSGNNGKGTLCEFMRNICGSGSYTSIPIKDFGKDYMLKPLLYVSAVIVDENDTGTFLNSADAFKAAITHDVIRANIKFKEPKDIRFEGMMVQCVNELPKFSDKSESLYRRILPIHMNKSFKGVERKYIKHDYLARSEVLEYALHKVLNMNYYELNEPESCLELLGEVKHFNDPVRQFLDDTLYNFSWDLVPKDYLYMFYKGWFEQNVPSGKVISKTAFSKEVNQLIKDGTYTDWELQDTPIQAKGRMDFPEPLIITYNVQALSDPVYKGSDPNKKSLTPLAENAKFRGIIRNSSVIKLRRTINTDN